MKNPYQLEADFENQRKNGKKKKKEESITLNTNAQLRI